MLKRQIVDLKKHLAEEKRGREEQSEHSAQSARFLAFLLTSELKKPAPHAVVQSPPPAKAECETLSTCCEKPEYVGYAPCASCGTSAIADDA